MMILACLTVANLIATGALGWLVYSRRRSPAAKRAALPASTGPNHYELYHDHHVVYDGYDCDEAYRWHVEMERHPAQFPGLHQYIENGHVRVSRHHTEISS